MDGLAAERKLPDRKHGWLSAVALAAAFVLALGLVAGGPWAWVAVVAAAILVTVTALAARWASAADLALALSRADYERMVELPAQVRWTGDSRGRIVSLSARWTEWTGQSLDDSRTADWIRIVHPDDQSAVIAAWADARACEQAYDQEYRVRMRNGQFHWMRARATPYHDAGERLKGWIGALEDIHDRRVAEETLRQTASLLEMIGTSTESLIYAKDRDGRMLYANRALERLAGVSLADILGKTDSEWHDNPVEAEAFAAADRQIIAGNRGIEVDEMFTGGGGTTRYFRSLKGPLRDRSGKVIGIVAISTDVTEKREAEEREQLLGRELDHRAKNMLAIVGSVVALTRASSVAEFKRAIDGRIQALGRAHSMLAASRWDGAELQRILSDELAPYGDDRHGRVHLSGPPLLLKPAAAQSLSLVFHELATNAAKYGALSVAEGRLEIAWEVVAANGKSATLHLDWRERGGPSVAPRTERSRQGFGSRLIHSSVERQLGGSVELAWAEAGLAAKIVIPLDRSISGAGGEGASTATIPSRRHEPRNAP